MERYLHDLDFVKKNKTERTMLKSMSRLKRKTCEAKSHWGITKPPCLQRQMFSPTSKCPLTVSSLLRPVRTQWKLWPETPTVFQGGLTESRDGGKEVQPLLAVVWRHVGHSSDVIEMSGNSKQLANVCLLFESNISVRASSVCLIFL